MPRCPYDRTGGIVYFARMLNKIRLYAAGTSRVDFHANLGSGFDGGCCRFLGVDYTALRDRLRIGDNDEEILSWCFAHGTGPTEEQVLVWIKFMLSRITIIDRVPRDEPSDKSGSSNPNASARILIRLLGWRQPPFGAQVTCRTML